MQSFQLFAFFIGLHSSLCFDIKTYFDCVSMSNYGRPEPYQSHGGFSIMEIPKHHPLPHDEIVYPCEIFDTDCIRKFLANNSECQIAYGPATDPLPVPKAAIPLPAVNITLTPENMIVEGLKSAKIKEFYLNKSSGNVVISFIVHDLTQRAQKTTFNYKRKAKESVALTDYALFTFPSTIFTAVIPLVPRLRLEDAEMNGYANDPHVIHSIGPKAYESKDPEVIHQFSAFIANLGLMATEAMAAQAPLVTTLLIQQNLCDFGIKME